ncbi:MAG: DUF1003 domain-containing protein [Desulfurivibrio sp.]|nr:DUF1003 domain-containing protein [Desulfurivibrio sp.]MBU3936753.1 DUF1003 domain-containing protein [Pseudomonadota bacterium]MBU4034403.1 DUF1003 domain-containing protein [Pseudomonadota bacterium]MBU4119403.1 DUF1003 domain-containing protein [Pseudomonadota bacterium]
MTKLRFPQPFKHEHPPVQNVNQIIATQLTFGQKASDWVAMHLGSWWFIVIQTIILALWVIINITAWLRHWDPYPFIFMNLVLSLQAAYAAPIIMMSQNRQANRDRLEARNDYQINERAEQEVRAILEHLAAQDAALLEIHQLLAQIQEKLGLSESASAPQENS